MAKRKYKKKTSPQALQILASGEPKKSSCTTPFSSLGTLQCIQIYLSQNFLHWPLLSFWNILKPSPRHGHGLLPWLAVPVVNFCIWLHNQIPHRTGRHQSLRCPSYLAVQSVFPPKSKGICLPQLKDGVCCVTTRWSKPNCFSAMESVSKIQWDQNKVRTCILAGCGALHEAPPCWGCLDSRKSLALSPLGCITLSELSERCFLTLLRLTLLGKLATRSRGWPKQEQRVPVMQTG